MSEVDEGELMHSRIGAGYRSAEVIVIDQTSATLSIASANKL